MKIKLKNLVNLDNYLSKRESKLLFLIIILAVLPSSLFGVQNMNLWDKLITIIANPITNIMLFLGIIIIILNIKKVFVIMKYFISDLTIKKRC